MIRRATADDVEALALAMPGARRVAGPQGNPVYQVSGRSFVFFRTPRPDAVDPETGEKLTDVIMFWVCRDIDKTVLVGDDSTPFFTTPHFDGHPSILVQGSRLGEIGVDELQEIIEDAWLARASKTAANKWLDQHPEVDRLDD